MKSFAPFGVFACLLVIVNAPAALAQKAAPPVKGQKQLAGGPAQFGVIYTLKNKFNFAILGGHYTLEPYNAYGGFAPRSEEKLLVLDLAIKNADAADNFFNTDGLFTLVDATGQLYTGGSLALESKGATEPNTNLRPGQGLGQPGLKDPLHIAWNIPANARIVKVMINTGRLYAKPEEDVFRYFIAGATKAEAGADGDPKNIIAPLPANVVDPADKSGAVALPEGKGAVGAWLPSGGFHLRFDSATITADPVTGDPPEEGKTYVVETLTAKLVVNRDLAMFDVMGNDPLYEITDTDGEHYKPVKFLKAKTTDEPDNKFQKDDEVTFRVVFMIPKAAKIKKLVIGCGDSRKWAFDSSVLK